MRDHPFEKERERKKKNKSELKIVAIAEEESISTFGNVFPRCGDAARYKGIPNKRIGADEVTKNGDGWHPLCGATEISFFGSDRPRCQSVAAVDYHRTVSRTCLAMRSCLRPTHYTGLPRNNRAGVGPAAAPLVYTAQPPVKRTEPSPCPIV